MTTKTNKTGSGPPSRQDTSFLIAEAQLLLAEKRTSLATTRTGIAVLVLPVSVVSLLVATSKLYDITKVAHLAYPLLALCALLLCVGGYLVFRSIRNIRIVDRHMGDLKRSNPNLAHLMD